MLFDQLLIPLFLFKRFQSIQGDQLLHCLGSGKCGSKFAEKIRSFALTLNFYSPKAYTYLRSSFNNTLPAISTIRSWYSSIDGSPGFSMDAFEELKHKAAAAKKCGTQIIANLIYDEMYIHKHVQYDHSTKRFVGYINYGINHETKTNEDGSLPLATQALVFIVSGINEQFIMPVGYFLIHHLKTSEKATIVQEAILLMSKAGVRIIGMTFDGLKNNLTVCEELGINFDSSEPSIINPHTDDKIHVFLDAPHMEKLARNVLARNKVLYDENDEAIKWEYFESLEELQRKEGFNFGNKLNKTHIQWHKKKMNVRIAVETLSNSVADTMEVLKNSGHEAFQGCEATIRYIRYMNNLFDIMNSMRLNATGFKRPLSKETSADFFAYLSEATQYLKTIKLQKNGKSILKTASKTAYFGFIQNIKNLKNIYRDYIESDIVERIFTYSFSQDHIEILFGRIRARLGSNDNPTAEQFKSAYRRMFVINEITASKSANCIDTGFNILTVSSRRPKLDERIDSDKLSNESSYDELHDDDQTEDEIISGTEINLVKKHSICYTAHLIEKSIFEGKSRMGSIKCFQCVSVLYENEQVQNELLEKKSNSKSVFQPCKSTVEICNATDDIIATFDHINKINHAEIVKDVMYKLDQNTLFTMSDFSDHSQDTHKSLLIQYIAEMYLFKRCTYISKCSTLAQHDEFKRHNMRKAIHEYGQ